MGSHQLEHRRLGGSGFRVIKHAAKTDLQGSVRAVMNNNGVGTSTVIARHDYLPFGEEISSGVGMRTGSQGYNVPDSNRQKYAMLECFVASQPPARLASPGEYATIKLERAQVESRVTTSATLDKAHERRALVIGITPNDTSRA